MEKKKNTLLLILNGLAFIGTIAWAIFEPSFEPFIGIILTGAGLVGLGFSKREKNTSSTNEEKKPNTPVLKIAPAILKKKQMMGIPSKEQ
jgi:hypothetical protein